MVTAYGNNKKKEDSHYNHTMGTSHYLTSPRIHGPVCSLSQVCHHIQSHSSSLTDLCSLPLSYECLAHDAKSTNGLT